MQAVRSVKPSFADFLSATSRQAAQISQIVNTVHRNEPVLMLFQQGHAGITFQNRLISVYLAGSPDRKHQGADSADLRKNEYSVYNKEQYFSLR